MAIVSVIGHKMRNKVGVASEILSTLAAAKINIYLVSQGASEINVSYVHNHVSRDVQFPANLLLQIGGSI